jgi:hypothetical protein
MNAGNIMCCVCIWHCELYHCSNAAGQDDVDTVCCIVLIRTVLRRVSAIVKGYCEVVLKKWKDNTRRTLPCILNTVDDGCQNVLCIPYCNCQMLEFFLYIKFVLFKEREYKLSYKLEGFCIQTKV